MISVIIPTYNREKTIERAVYSVLNQTFKDIEVIVVDDCSTDNTIKLLEGIDDRRLRIISLKKNEGACRARNVGIESAIGEYITFQDSDDEWYVNKLEVQYNALIEKNVDIVACSFVVFNKKKRNAWPKEKMEEDYFARLLQENYITTQALFLRKECLQKIRFDENLPRYQDWELAIRLLQKYSFYFINMPLMDLYVQKDSLTNNYVAGMIAAQYILEKHREVYEVNPKSDKMLKKIIAYGKMKSHCFEKNYYKEILLEYGFDFKIIEKLLEYEVRKLFYSLRYR